MLFRALRPKLPGLRTPQHMAEAHLPVRLGEADGDRSFARPVDRGLRALGLGKVTGAGPRRAASGEIEGLDLYFGLVTLHPRALRTVGQLLEELDAPVGSSVSFSETGVRHIFGRTEGLGLYLDRRDGIADEDDRLDVLEACTDALAGQGLYQGSSDLGDRAVLYFYGDSFNAMKNALSLVMTTNPRCRHAYARRLT